MSNKDKKKAKLIKRLREIKRKKLEEQELIKKNDNEKV